MSDWIEQNGRRYYEASYLELANRNRERADQIIATLQAQIAALTRERDELRNQHERTDMYAARPCVYCNARLLPESNVWGCEKSPSGRHQT